MRGKGERGGGEIEVENWLIRGRRRGRDDDGASGRAVLEKATMIMMEREKEFGTRVLLPHPSSDLHCSSDRPTDRSSDAISFLEAAA